MDAGKYGFGGVNPGRGDAGSEAHDDQVDEDYVAFVVRFLGRCGARRVVPLQLGALL